MSRANQLFAYFPLAMMAATFWSLGVFAAWPSWWSALVVFSVIYGAPPITLRIVTQANAIRDGVSQIDRRAFNPWLAAHHIQAFYDALPFLESLLRVAPGFYSMWLRLWGSHIGYGVDWPVRLDVRDRNLLDVGNRAAFGHDAYLAGHVRRRTDGGARVLVRRIRIGAHAFVGAGARMGPGAIAPANTFVPAMASVNVNETFGQGVRHAAPEEAEFALS